MCAGGDVATVTGASVPPHIPVGSDEELKWLREQHTKLTRQLCVHEQSLKEQRSELTQRHGEEIAQRVARHAREIAANALRHEEELRRMATRYEEQLLARHPSLSSSSRVSMSPPHTQTTLAGALSRQVSKEGCSMNTCSWQGNASGSDCKKMTEITVALSQERQRAQDALVANEATMAQLRLAEAEAARYRKRAHKLKASRAEERRGVRTCICNSVLDLVARGELRELGHIFFVWSGFARHCLESRRIEKEREDAWQRREVQLEARISPQRKCLEMLYRQGHLRPMALGASVHLLSVATARPLASLMKALRAWSGVVAMARHESQLRSFADTAAAQSKAALAVLRDEARLIAEHRSRIAIDATEVKALLHLVIPFCAWAREVKSSHVSTSGTRNGDTTLNTQRALAAANGFAVCWSSFALHTEIFRIWATACAQAKREAALRTQATHRQRPVDIVLNSGEAARRKQQELDDERSRAAMQLESLSEQLKVANKRGISTANHASHLEVAWIREQSAARLLLLFRAWVLLRAESLNDAALNRIKLEAEQREHLLEKRQQTALACARNESTSALHQAWNEAAEASRHAAALERRERVLQEELERRPPTAVGERPATGARPFTGFVQNEVQLEQLEHGSSTEMSHEPEVWTLPQESEVRSNIRHLLESMMRRHERYWQSGPFEGWRRVTAELRCARELNRVRADAMEDVLAARDGRKGLFVAAIGQQVRQFKQRALYAWRVSMLAGRAIPASSPSGARYRDDEFSPSRSTRHQHTDD